MEINLFSKCIKDLILVNDKVEVPYLGVFTAELLPASYSDHQTTIHPPYRKMSFHKENIALEEGRLLLEKVMKESDVSMEQAGVELGWCLSRLSSELEGHKSCRLPGLGTMRANARNEFFFVPDDDLDIWPDGIGFEPISIKVSEKMTDASEEQRSDEKPEQVRPAAAWSDAWDEKPAPQSGRRQLRPIWIVVAVVLALLVLFIAAAYLFTDEMSPILDRLLYTKEELELLRR